MATQYGSPQYGFQERVMIDEILDEEAISDAYLFDDASTIVDPPDHSTRTPFPDFVPSAPRQCPVAMDNLDFLKLSPGNAALTVILPDEVTVTISDLDPDVISQQCPLLAVSFESGISGEPKASIEAPSLIVAICFLRFCYTGSYMPNWDSVDENSNCSLLIHAQICHIGEIFDAPGLQAMAHFNVIRETELACCRPTAPPDLTSTIRYIFEYLSSQKGLIDTIINYCVNCFQYHRLGTNPEFRKMAYELQEFTRELSRVNMQRDFLDDGASEIIRLPCIPTEHSEAQFARKVLGDFVFEIFSSDPLYAPPSPPFRPLNTSSSTSSSSSTPLLGPQSGAAHPLPLRPKSAYLLVPRKNRTTTTNGSSSASGYYSSADESSSEDEETSFADFTLVRRPRDHADTYVEPETGARFSAYDDSDTETLRGREDSPVLVPADAAGGDAEVVVVEREGEGEGVRRRAVAREDEDWDLL